MVLAVAALGAFFLLFFMDLFAKHANPYTGILAYVVAPMFLLAGLAIVLLGYILETRRIRKGGVDRRTEFIWHVDLSRKRDRRILVLFLGGSVGFLFLTALGSYETYHLMETNSFCGETCHTPMEPEYKAYQHSAHAQVDCVACHIGPGTKAYIRHQGQRGETALPPDHWAISTGRSRLSTRTCGWPRKPARPATGPRSISATCRRPSGISSPTRPTPRSP